MDQLDPRACDEFTIKGRLVDVAYQRERIQEHGDSVSQPKKDTKYFENGVGDIEWSAEVKLDAPAVTAIGTEKMSPCDK